jgi:hypothetical protein
MPRWRRTEVGYLAFYPHIGVFLLNLLTNLIHKLAHRPNTAHELRRLKAEVKLLRRWILPNHL